MNIQQKKRIAKVAQVLASVTRTASSGYTMTIDGDTDNQIDLTSASIEDVLDALEQAGLRKHQDHYRSDRITYTGDYGTLWYVDTDTAQKEGSLDTTPATPIQAWCIAQLADTVGPESAYLAFDRSVVLSSADAKKFVQRNKDGSDGIHYFEGSGDADHFHEYVGGEYRYLVEERPRGFGVAADQAEAMSDADMGKLLIDKFFSHSQGMWRTDGHMMYYVTD